MYIFIAPLSVFLSFSLAPFPFLIPFIHCWFSYHHIFVYFIFFITHVRSTDKFHFTFRKLIAGSDLTLSVLIALLWRDYGSSSHPHNWILPWLYLEHCIIFATLGTVTGPCSAIRGALGHGSPCWIQQLVSSIFRFCCLGSADHCSIAYYGGNNI